MANVLIAKAQFKKNIHIFISFCLQAERRTDVSVFISHLLVLDTEKIWLWIRRVRFLQEIMNKLKFCHELHTDLQFTSTDQMGAWLMFLADSFEKLVNALIQYSYEELHLKRFDF